MAVDIGEMLDRLLTEGAHHFDDTHDYRLTMIPAGRVSLPTGHVVACDPLSGPGETPPFTVTVPPGRYPLRAWVAVACPASYHGVESDRRTAALQLVVRDEPVATWEPARPARTGPSFVDEDGFFAYPADCGTATLADRQALAALRAWPYERVERTYLPEPSPPAPAALDAVTDRATGANVVTVCTGPDDGGYATFVGRTADGEVASFVTDFRVL
ncbi:DUF4241 domain-containing protein [Actinoplanes sp. NPDC049548]|uniref:DUF4241 domain-containing protein n=1 Tax=Actinoplanes sp. NPDC049548 TaxID=3155152 RepID=UPI0034328E4C